MRIEAITRVEEGLLVTVGGAEGRLFTWRWLLDHSDDPASVDPASKQRVVPTFDIAADVEPTHVRLADDGSLVHLGWADPDRETTCSAGLFEGLLVGLTQTATLLWQTDGEASKHHVFAFQDVLGDDEALLGWLDSVRRLGFGVVSGLPATEEAATSLAERIATPRSTVFGAMWRLASEMDEHQDSAYSTTFLEPHTDSTYMTDAPGTQLFCCLARTGSGGESILVDGFAIAEKLRSVQPAAFDILTSVHVPGRYVEPGVHLNAQRPPIRLGAAGNVEQVTFNNYDRAPFWLPEPQMSGFYDAYALFHDYIVDQSRWFELALRPGDALIFDNWRLLHGRQAYSGRRVFYGCYHNRDDFLSRRRVISRSVVS